MVTKSPQSVNPVGRFLRKIFSEISTFFQALIVFISFLFVIPAVIPLLFPLYTFRYIVFKLTPHLRPQFGKMLSSRSAIFAADDIYTKPLCTVVGKLGIEGKLNMEKQKQIFQEFWLDAKYPNGDLKHPELTQYVTYFLGFPFWYPEKHFKLDEHVKLMDRKFIKSPDGIATETEVVDYMTYLGLKPFKSGTSPWQVLLANMGTGSDNKSKYYFILRWHHCLADGLGMVKLYSNFSDLDLKAIPHPEKIKNRRRNFFHPLCQILRTPYDAVKGPIESKDKISDNSWHLPASQLKRTWSCAFSDEQVASDYVKEIKNGHKVSFNAVVMAGMTGAVRSLMLANNTRKMPDYILAGIPTPAKGHPDKLRNCWSICTVKLPVGEKSAVKRLHYIDRKLKRLKRSTLPIAAFFVIPFIGSLFNWIVKFLVKNRNTSMILSVMPGPQRVFQNHLGEICHSADFSVSLGDGNTGFGMSAMTYAGQLRFGATVDHAFLKTSDPTSEVKNLANEACNELKELKNLIKTQV